MGCAGVACDELCMIRPTDEARLLWYFGSGAAELERSPSGAMLERQWALHMEHAVDPEIAAARRAREPWEADPGAITARPTAEVTNPGRSSPIERDVIKHGDISKQLQRAVAIHPSARVILSLFYGDDGCTWARHRAGRGGSLLHLTRTGQRLLRVDTAGPHFDLSARERLENLFADHKHGPLLAKALAEAQRLFDVAASAWTRAEERK